MSEFVDELFLAAMSLHAPPAHQTQQTGQRDERGEDDPLVGIDAGVVSGENPAQDVFMQVFQACRLGDFLGAPGQAQEFHVDSEPSPAYAHIIA